MNMHRWYTVGDGDLVITTSNTIQEALRAIRKPSPDVFFDDAQECHGKARPHLRRDHDLVNFSARSTKLVL